jgi:hypothetical protein
MAWTPEVQVDYETGEINSLPGNAHVHSIGPDEQAYVYTEQARNVPGQFPADQAVPTFEGKNAPVYTDSEMVPVCPQAPQPSTPQLFSQGSLGGEIYYPEHYPDPTPQPSTSQTFGQSSLGGEIYYPEYYPEAVRQPPPCQPFAQSSLGGEIYAPEFYTHTAPPSRSQPNPEPIWGRETYPREYYSAEPQHSTSQQLYAKPTMGGQIYSTGHHPLESRYYENGDIYSTGNHPLESQYYEQWTDPVPPPNSYYYRGSREPQTSRNVEAWARVHEVYGTAIGIILKCLQLQDYPQPTEIQWLRDLGLTYTLAPHILQEHYYGNPSFYEIGEAVFTRKPRDLKECIRTGVESCSWPGNTDFSELRNAFEAIRRKGLDLLDRYRNTFDDEFRRLRHWR